MPEYTIAAVGAVVAVVVLERRVWRSGIYRRPAWWVSLAICAGFMVLVNGWLTKLSAPIVRYDDDRRLLPRAPWDIPVEDFLFGFAMLSLATMWWLRSEDRPTDAPAAADGDENAF